jgi:hypothetical protein
MFWTIFHISLHLTLSLTLTLFSCVSLFLTVKHCRKSFYCLLKLKIRLRVTVWVSCSYLLSTVEPISSARSWVRVMVKVMIRVRVRVRVRVS